MVNASKLTQIFVEIEEATVLPPYSASSELWVCLVKMANLLPTVGEEHEQMVSLLRQLPKEGALQVLRNAGVDCLLALDPALESILAEPRERLALRQTTQELGRIRKRRNSDPKAALLALFEILQRIRDKKSHGFKTPKGPRDDEILRSATTILQDLCRSTGEHLLLLVELEPAEQPSERITTASTGRLASPSTGEA